MRSPSLAARLHRVVARMSFAALGGLIPLYLLDESVWLKQVAPPLIASAIVATILTSVWSPTKGTVGWRLAFITFAAGYTLALAYSAVVHGVSVNALYPLLFLAICWVRVDDALVFARTFTGSLGFIVLLGWYRFVTGDGGLVEEHALGYWGIKYTTSTRNGDALAPLLSLYVAVAVLTHADRPSLALWLKGSLWVLVAMSASALALTFSRSAWVAAVVFLLLRSSGHLARLLMLAIGTGVLLVVCYFGLLIAAPEVATNAVDILALLERVRSIYDPSVDSSNVERLRLAGYALELGLTNPIVGVGAGRFDCCFAETGYLDLAGGLHPENLFLHLLTEYGVLSSAGLLMLLMASMNIGLRSAVTAQRTAGALLGSMIVWLQLNSELPSLLVWCVLAVSVGVASDRPRWTAMFTDNDVRRRRKRNRVLGQARGLSQARGK